MLSKSKLSQNRSVEAHLESTKNLVSSAEMFVSGAEDAQALRSSAENFISMAENHIAAAEAMVSTSKKHLISLKRVADAAETSASHVSTFLGAEDTVPKTSPKKKTR